MNKDDEKVDDTSIIACSEAIMIMSERLIARFGYAPTMATLTVMAAKFLAQSDAKFGSREFVEAFLTKYEQTLRHLHRQQEA